MISVKDFLNRIKWDKSLDPEEYAIFYEGNKGMEQVRFISIDRFEGNFMVFWKGGKEVEIPMHKIRQIRRDGKSVWRRA